MSMYCTTFKLDGELIRTKLIDRLRETTNCTITFADFITNTNNKPRGYRFPKPFKPYDVEEIISSLMDVENLVSVYDLGIVFNWLRNLENHSYLWNTVKGCTFSYADYGFIEIYDLGQSDKCWVYMNQEAEYSDFNNLNKDTDPFFSLYPNNYYRSYLDYLQLLLAKICLDKEYKNHMWDHSSNEELINYLNTHQMDQVLEKQTESALKNIREENQAYDNDRDYELGHGRESCYSHYIVAEQMFYQIRDVKKALGDYTGKIFNDFVY